MKKLIAILLSVLMLCSVAPFAAVAAAEGDPTIQLSIVDELESVNAGEEVQVQVDLLGLEETDGLMYALVKIDYDPAVFELVTYFDEDEEAWMPPIEVGSKYNASSNKYIMFGQIDEETGKMENCLVRYNRATATANQVRREEHFYTVTFKVKDNAPSGTYNLTVADNAQLIYYGSVPATFNTVNTSITVNGTEPTPPSCTHEYDNACDVDCNLCGEVREVEHNVAHVEAKDATCTELGNIEYWYCDVCGMAWLDEACTQNTNLMAVKLPMVDHEYFYACDPVCMNCYEITNPEAAHSMSHVEAKDATCFENGNIEYWTCEHCGGCWDNEAATGMPLNQMMVVVPMAHDELTHVEAKDATCFENGNIEYWYCEACGMAWLDAEGTLNTNLMAVVLPMAHNELTHVEAKAPTCFENGNIEYWYCEACGYAWLDAEGTLSTNLLAVVLPMAHSNIEHVAAKDATCTELGNIEYWYCADCGYAWLDEACTQNTNLMAVKLPMIDHVYTNVHDAFCDVCGAEREVVLGAEDIIIESGNSVTEIRGGLAFKFDVAASGIVIGEDYVADYTNAIVTIGGEEFKLVTMGAIVNNKGLADQTLENVDDSRVLNIVANKVFDLEEDGTPSYAIRIINIPAEHLDTVITARSYFVYENLVGEQFTVYGEDWATSYNAVVNG